MSIYQDRTKKYIGMAITSSNAGGTVTIPINGAVTNTPTTGGGYVWYDPYYQFLTGTSVGTSSVTPKSIIPGTNIYHEGTRTIYKIKKERKMSLFDWVKINELMKQGRIEEID